MDLSSPGIVEHVLKGIMHWVEILRELQNRGHNLTDQERDAVASVANQIDELAGGDSHDGEQVARNG